MDGDLGVGEDKVVGGQLGMYLCRKWSHNSSCHHTSSTRMCSLQGVGIVLLNSLIISEMISTLTIPVTVIIVNSTLARRFSRDTSRWYHRARRTWSIHKCIIFISRATHTIFCAELSPGHTWVIPTTASILW